IVERAVLMGNPPTVEKADLLTSALGVVEPPVVCDCQKRAVATENAPFEPVSLKEMERKLVLETLNHFSWNKSRAAKSLGVERTTLDRKIAAYSLTKEAE
ncbi:MAG: hypothetical protein IJ387_03730, partial [Thermoguttaceae bacterium]|nr:hypothetical protein [Thermoguttaceae bacterium]